MLRGCTLHAPRTPQSPAQRSIRPCRPRGLAAAAAAAAELRAALPAPSAVIRGAGAYEPGWSPEEMRGDMKALEAAAEELLGLLRGDTSAQGGAAGLLTCSMGGAGALLQVG
jgi:hypothetical protein